MAPPDWLVTIHQTTQRNIRELKIQRRYWNLKSPFSFGEDKSKLVTMCFSGSPDLAGIACLVIRPQMLRQCFFGP